MERIFYQAISKREISYKVHWILLFKLINFRKIEFYLNKVVGSCR
jgi:hypothetical protein